MSPGQAGQPAPPQMPPGAVREELVLERIDRVRRARPRLREDRITMSHGAGGKATQTLIEAVFLRAFRNPLLEPLEDAARVHVNGARVALTTDSYVVSPLFFPGGDIGDLAVNGTVNDLAVSGATPLYLSAGFILEEGFEVADLTRITASMQAAAQAAGVQIVTGDTKVVEKGKADGCYISTAGVGVIERDVTLGVALATILSEIATAAGVGVVVTEDDIPVRVPVRGAAELLGIDPMYVACEGRLIAVVDGDQADHALAVLRAHPRGEQAAIIGRVTGEPPGIVQLKTAFGGTRIVDVLVGDPLPRIC